MSLNLDKFKDALVSTWREVMDEKNPTDWAMFGYEGQTFDLKLVSKGDGGLEEMVEDFNSGKIMYGLCRVKLKEKNLEKVALINWQGEGAPLAKKGTCANHVGTIKNFFKGVHVTINARTDEDVSPDVIIAAVAKATSGEGLKMSSNYEAEGKMEPIGSCYKRVNPQAEINAKAKDDFWRKEEQEEERRKRDEQNKVRKFSQNEVKLLRRESQDYFNEQEEVDLLALANKSPSCSPNLHGEVTNGISVSNGVPASRTPDTHAQTNSLTSEDTSSISPTPIFSNSFIASEKAAALKASIPKRNSASENLVRQRIKSFDGDSGGTVPLTNRNGGTAKNGQDSESLSVLRRKQLFESGGASNTSNDIVRKNPALEINNLLQENQKRLELEKNSTTWVPVRSPNLRTPTPENLSERTETPVSQRTPSPMPAASPTPAPTKAYNLPLPFHVGGSVSGKLAETINKNSENIDSRIKISESEEFSSRQEDSTVHSGEIFDTGAVEPVTIIAQSGKASPVINITEAMGLCARALYDYQAADDSEITFDPGEIITNIERIDEGWWEGMGPRGIYGLFPANYVELLN